MFESLYKKLHRSREHMGYFFQCETGYFKGVVNGKPDLFKSNCSL